MKPALAALFFAGSALRLWVWASDRAAALDACALLESRRSAGQYTALTGEWEAREGGVLHLAGVRDETGRAISLPAFLDPAWAEGGPDPRRRARVTGPWRCTRPLKNLSFWGLTAPHLS